MPYLLFEELKRYVGFGPEDEEVLRAAYGAVKRRFPEIVDDFYREIELHEATRRILQDPQQIQRLKKSLLQWLSEVFLEPHDRTYAEKRARIGLTHVRVGLPQAFVFTAMSRIRQRLREAILGDARAGPQTLQARMLALDRTLDLELALIAGAYHEAEKYHDVVEFAPDMIHQVDREGRLVSVNRTEEEKLGYKQAQLVGRKLEELVHEQDRAAVRNHLQQVFRDGESRCEARLLTSSGQILHVEILSRGERHVLTDEIIRSRAYLRDITERKRMARVLAEQASLARLGEMAAMVAHEVRNPLAGIAGAIQVIGSNLPTDNSSQPIIQEILARIDGLNGFVSDMLIFSRPREPRLAPVPMLSLVQDTVSLLLQDAKFDRLDVETHGKDLVVPCDVELLKTVFLNLLLNAAEAMEGKGRIAITVGNSQGSCQVSVADNGPGIPPAVLEKIFQPFYSTKHQGSGLGLAIAKRIVEAHGGEIEVVCPSAGGTTVTVRLPLEPGPAHPG